MYLVAGFIFAFFFAPPPRPPACPGLRAQIQVFFARRVRCIPTDSGPEFCFFFCFCGPRGPPHATGGRPQFYFFFAAPPRARCMPQAQILFFFFSPPTTGDASPYFLLFCFCDPQALPPPLGGRPVLSFFLFIPGPCPFPQATASIFIFFDC